MKRIFALLYFISAVFLYSSAIAQNIAKDRLLTNSDIVGKSPEELAYMRNLIYAKHGYRFSNPMYENHFRERYKAIDDNSKIKLNATETQNVEMLKTKGDKLLANRAKAIQDLKELKRKLDAEDTATFALFYESDIDYNSAEILQAALDHLELEDIHYNKERGMYKLSMDNGYSIFYYEVCVLPEKIIIYSNSCCYSEIFGDFNDGYSDYESESEHADIWQFDINESGLVYRAYTPAG